MLDGMSGRLDYLPRGMLDWVEEHSWLLDEVASRWLATGEAPKRADLQKELMARGSDVYLADVLHGMPSPLIRTEAHEQRIMLSLLGLRVTPCMSEKLAGLGPLVALAAARYPEDEPVPSISVGDIQRAFGLDRAGAIALSVPLFAELPFLGSTTANSDAPHGEAREITEAIARYATAQSTDDYLRMRASEVRGHPQFGWRRWEAAEPSRDQDRSASPDAPPARRLAFAFPLTRLINHPWVVGIGGVVVGGVILAVILGHG